MHYIHLLKQKHYTKPRLGPAKINLVLNKLTYQVTALFSNSPGPLWMFQLHLDPAQITAVPNSVVLRLLLMCGDSL